MHSIYLLSSFLDFPIYSLTTLINCCCPRNWLYNITTFVALLPLYFTTVVLATAHLHHIITALFAQSTRHSIWSLFRTIGIHTRACILVLGAASLAVARRAPATHWLSTVQPSALISTVNVWNWPDGDILQQS